MRLRIRRLIILAALPAILPLVAGAENFALRFDGQNDFVDCGPAAEMRQVQRNITIECWIRTQAADQRVMVTNRHADDGSDFPSLLIMNSCAGFCMDDQNIRFEAVSQTRINDNRWHHIAGVRSGDRWSIVVDGQEEAVVERAYDMSGSQYNLHFGHHGAWNNFYVGDIDDIRIWTVARSIEQIRATMNIMLSGNENGLYGYWPLNEGQGQTTADFTRRNNGVLGANNQAGGDDPQWIRSETPIYGGTIAVEPRQLPFMPIAVDRSRMMTVHLANTSQQQEEWYSVEFQFTFPNNRPAWLSVDPLQGRIAPRENIDAAFTINAENLQPGNYQSTARLTCNAANLQQLDIPITAIVVQGVGHLSGRVTDAANARPVEGALVK
ncbi:MAG: LamG domain-containing protein, partial [Calditrichaeota bacterium]|nr:LamG domain-containing protein [Calditrichota bacterium]